MSIFLRNQGGEAPLSSEERGAVFEIRKPLKSFKQDSDKITLPLKTAFKNLNYT